MHYHEDTIGEVLFVAVDAPQVICDWLQSVWGHEFGEIVTVEVVVLAAIILIESVSY